MQWGNAEQKEQVGKAAEQWHLREDGQRYSPLTSPSAGGIFTLKRRDGSEIRGHYRKNGHSMPVLAMRPSVYSDLPQKCFTAQDRIRIRKSNTPKSFDK
jgi:hypothetical protein